LIAIVVDGLSTNGDANGAVEAQVREEVLALCAKFPIYG
jgi:glycine hydroxymethyltransferase